ncbi:MAG: hypothetical protein ACK4GO_07940 [Gemmobacter sp.]
MADPKTVDPTREMEDLIAAARKIEHNFVMMKTKEGVVIEASKVKSCEGLVPLAKAKGGMAAMSVSGIMKVDGKVMTLRAADDDVQRALPRLAKKHFKALGIKCKVVIQLPGGALLDDEDDGGEGETRKVADGMVAPVAAPEDAEPDLGAALMARLRAVVPQVKALTDQGMAGADRLVAAVKAAGAEIAAEAHDRAGKLLDVIEAGVKASAPSTEDLAATREKLEREFRDLGVDLQRVLAEAEPPVAGKARAVAQMFTTEIERDLKKAAQALGVLRGFVEMQVARLAPVAPAAATAGGSGGDVPQALSGIAGRLAEAAEEIRKGAEELAANAGVSPQERSDAAMLDALGLPRDEQVRLLEEWKKDPALATAYKTKLIADAKVPADRQAEFLTLQVANPATFLAALAALKGIGADDTTDLSAAGIQEALAGAETARLELAARAQALAGLRQSAETAAFLASSAEEDTRAARLTASSAAQAIKDLEARIGDIKALSPEQRKAFQAESVRLINASGAAKKALAALEKGAADARKAAERAQAKIGPGEEALRGATASHAEAAAKLEKGKAAKGVMDAVGFGPLSPGARPPLKDADRAALVGVFATDSGLAEQAMAAARSAKDPSALAQNAALVAGKFKDGFADPSGRRLDLPPEQMRDMAANALRMGGEMGGGYFQGFDDYLKSGKQFDPDPSGGLAHPLPNNNAEDVRRKTVAQARTKALAGAALAPDGKVDFGSDAARGQMDHMLFHPGSLTVFTPMLNVKSAETAALFTDPATRDRAQGIITGTTLPGPSTPAKPTSPVTAKKILGNATGKAPGDVTDTDARASVLSAMMTPLSQGPVGSCFSTAPVRALRETDPLAAMQNYAAIASTGLFTPHGKPPVPANTRAHEGENPLLRSWEYSVATAGANMEGSVEKRKLGYGLFRADDSANNLEAVKGIMGLDDAGWLGGADPVTGDLIEGMQSKLVGAILRELPLEYNPIAPASGGGGDGRSTDGRFELMYKGAPIRSEAEFTTAMKEIALAVTGEAEGSAKGAQIVALVTGAPFVASVVNTFKDANGNGDFRPWKLSSGGMENAAKKVVKGGNPTIDTVLANVGTPPPSRSERTAGILGAVLGKHGEMPGDMHMLRTSGADAGHAFNALPKHPSMDKIRDPDSAAKIQRELIEPGRAIASAKMPGAQAARLYQDQVEAMMQGRNEVVRKALVGMMKKAPKADMTPAEIATRVMTDARAAISTARAQAFIASDEPRANTARKAVILKFYEDAFDKDESPSVEARMREQLMATLQPPMVVVADSNWGGPEQQDYFVAAPDPISGELVMWTRTEPGGRMAPLGKNWEDGPWGWIKP